MPGRTVHAVTGVFGFSGKSIARRLLESGRDVITLTNSSPGQDDDLAVRLRAHPFCFDRPDELSRSLEGVDVLYNTYWVRFNHRRFRHDEAVRNTRILFDAAKRAGVRRVVHTSITNPSESSPLEYFRGKAVLERALRDIGLSHAILRPAVIFGESDILVNNIAWAIRHLPIFGIFGDGAYRLIPIHVEDFARLAVEAGERDENETIDAIGPEVFTYRELVETIAERLGIQRRIVSVSPWLGHLAAKGLGLLVRDVVLTREEIRGLMADLLFVDAPAVGTTRLTDWIDEHAATLGTRYASELARRR